MSPLDDQLRAALHGRAATLAPASDPLAGIERRARGLRRRRVAASVAGAALAVAAIAVAVPALQTGPSKGPEQVATTPTADASFDPAKPWAFRGRISDGTLQHFRDELQARSPGDTLIPLFGQTYEPSGQEELAFAATDRSGRVAIIGYVSGSESGAEFLNFTPPSDLASFLFVLPGDEVQRLVVVACPTCSITAAGTTLTELAPGVAVGPHERRVEYVVRDADGVVVGRGSAGTPGVPCDGGANSGGSCTGPAGPANVLDWPTRGAMESDLVAKLPEVYAPTLQTTADKVNFKVLFAGDTDSGVRFVMGQIWAAGDRAAHSFAYAEGGTNGPSVFFGPVTAPTAKVLAFLVDSLPGTTTDLLVVIPHPRTTQVMYDDNASGALRPVSDTPGADGVGLVDRSRTASTDRLQLLTGNGDPATDTTFQGPVATLLCGAEECS